MKNKKPPHNAEDSNLFDGYLTNKEKDDFLCYVIAKLETVIRQNQAVICITAVSLIINAIQVLALLLR